MFQPRICIRIGGNKFKFKFKLQCIQIWICFVLLRIYLTGSLACSPQLQLSVHPEESNSSLCWVHSNPPFSGSGSVQVRVLFRWLWQDTVHSDHWDQGDQFPLTKVKRTLWSQQPFFNINWKLVNFGQLSYLPQIIHCFSFFKV